MAQKGIKKAAQEGHLDLTLWANNMVQRLKENFERQKVWPRGFPGPYIGYRNTMFYKRDIPSRGIHRGQRKDKGWQSTGAGINSFFAKVWAGANGDTEKITLFFNAYLYFVDMGVGVKKPIEKVDRSANAHWKRRYKDWNGKGDRQSRPMLAMEIRHQLLRLETMVSVYYQDYVENGILYSFEDAKGFDKNNVSKESSTWGV